jgi:hypothetical protein
MKKIPEEMEKRIQKMALRTWDMIGSDMLHCCEEAGEPPVMPKSHVVEVVCDADYMSMYGADKEAYIFFNTLSYPEKKKVVGKAFTFPRYGF